MGCGFPFKVSGLRSAKYGRPRPGLYADGDQTKGGFGRGPRVQRTPRFGAESERFDLTRSHLSSKLSPKVKKNLPRNS